MREISQEQNSCHQKKIPVTRNELKSQEKFLAKEWNMPNEYIFFQKKKMFLTSGNYWLLK
jgi:hypothetical protein